MGFVLAAIAVQCIGTGLVAFFLWQLGRAMQVRFLATWAAAAVTLAVALACLSFTFQSEPHTWYNQMNFLAYLLGSYVTAFLLWSGLREYTHGRAFGFRDLWRLAPFLTFAAVVPWLVTTYRSAVPYHFFGMGVLLLAALPATRFVTPPPRPSVGMPIVRSGLALLVGLMAVHGYLLLHDTEGIDFTYHWSSLISTSLAQLLTVLGIVILACERIRDQLHANNERLAAAQAELEKVARTDGLTGLLNRHAFEDWAASHAHEAASGCLAVIDLNDLKLLNDSHLHAAGDAGLKLVARALNGKFRVTDPIFRIGGDEFVVAMPGGTEAELQSRLTAIDVELQNQRLPGVPHPYTLVLAWGTASFTHGDERKLAYQKADRAMYAQKTQRKVRPDFPF